MPAKTFIPDPGALVANVLFSEPNVQMLAQMNEAVEAGWARREGGFVWFDVEGYLSVWDEDDADSAPLFVMYADEKAEGAVLYAPDCGEDISEMERRIYRDLSPDFTVDDHGPAVKVEPTPPRSTVTWIDQPEVGKVVRSRVSGPGYDTPQSGTFVGVLLDEQERVPYYYFVRGEINGHAQQSFGSPAPLDTEVTDRRSPTTVIREALAPTVGSTWRSPVGGKPMTVVATDERFVYVKHSDESKKSLANPAGAHIVGRVEFESWKAV